MPMTRAAWPLADSVARSPSAPRRVWSPRAAAALALRDVLGAGRALDVALEGRLGRLTDGRDRGLAREIAFGVLRFLPRLRLLSQLLMERPLAERDLDLDCLLLGGLYQLLYLRVPEHAAVAETVGAARLLGKPWAAGLLNGVLRGFLRRRGELLATLAERPAAEHCFPDWLLERLRDAWPRDWREITAASNRHPPMVLRVNVRRLTTLDYARQLATAGHAARPLAAAPQALVLDQPLDVEALPGFAAGLVSVQDGAAQLAAPLLEAVPGDRVLDACAAPGGKLAHLLELGQDLDLTAVDADPARLPAIDETLARLGLTARVLAADITDGAGPWADRDYQRILLDVPCSATGVIRRHPDIKWLRRPQDLEVLARLQGRILDRTWPRLAPGGVLLYVTCSLLPEENQAQIQAFLERTPDARELPIEAPWGRPCAPGRQVLPGEQDMDGFYFARLRKASGVR